MAEEGELIRMAKRNDNTMACGCDWEEDVIVDWWVEGWPEGQGGWGNAAKDGDRVFVIPLVE